MTAVQLRGTEFDTMESSVRLTNAQAGVLYKLLADPIISALTTDETKKVLDPIELLLLDALAADIEGYIK